MKEKRPAKEVDEPVKGSEAWKETEEEEDEEEDPREEARQANLSDCRDIFIFAIFLFVFTLAMLMEKSSSCAQLADHMEMKLTSGPVALVNVWSVPSLFDYLEQSFVPNMFDNNTDVMLAEKLSSHLHPIDVSNRVLGAVRLRQVRVNLMQSCEMRPMFSQYKIACYPSLSSSTECTDAFGPDLKFRHTADDSGSTYAGQIASYGPNGYMQFLPSNRTEALRAIQSLRREGFLDAATRAFFVDFTVWNSNVGVYAAVTIAIEFSASGGVTQQVNVLTMTERSLAAGGLGTATDLVSFIAVVVVMLFVLWYMSEEYSEIRDKRLAYLLDGWNVLDWVNMILLIAGFIVRILLLVRASGAQIGKKELQEETTFMNLRPLAESADLVKLLYAFNAVLLWGKVVKYLRKLPVVKVMIRTVWSAFELFLPFLFMFSVAFVGFAMAYNIGFGDKIFELSTFSSSLVSLCRSFMRDIRLMAVYEILPLFGAMLILLFYVSLVLVGVNVLFAILADALFQSKYESARKSAQQVDDLHEDEPLEEFVRTVHGIGDRVLQRWLPRAHYMLHRQSEQGEETGEEGKEAAPGGKPAQVLSLENQRTPTAGSATGSRWRGTNAALEDRASESGASQSQSGGSGSEHASRHVSREELIRAIEHMSGRVLSEVSIVGIEIRSELHDICERVAQMQMAVEELSWRAEKVKEEQQEEF